MLLFSQWTDGLICVQGSIKEVLGLLAGLAYYWVQSRAPFLWSACSLEFPMLLLSEASPG